MARRSSDPRYSSAVGDQSAGSLGGYATPAVYGVNGREYVVIAAGGGAGGWSPTPSGDAYVAFALPE